MTDKSSTGGWVLVYKRGIVDRCLGGLQFLGMLCFALLFTAALLVELGSLSGVRGLPLPDWTPSASQTFGYKVLHFVCLLVGAWLAYDSVSSFGKIVKDFFTWNRTYEGVLNALEERSYSGIRINYRMLALICTDTTWETYPRLKKRYMLKPGKPIRIFYTGGTKTIKQLWVQG